ncbi:hypothetical protein AWC05_05020 [Mycobacterium florentinum]|uniref:PBP domain-containing protein n=1 Tax=Mycobacterium florentinum TaxID=292462 RepID=A0A1X1TTS3_MYCFL|nr:hypothetical protein [Mycobacterium florentinum]ORV47943.1 hypothetical protein AWC05_05020 [Mycobacterium florentinum]BBX78120.1 hypothetical protein MFLOJ_19070 [Mycobacterium florentinum]
MNIVVAVSAPHISYNLPALTEHLKLDGKVLAAMYKGTIKTWNDPQISALNPGQPQDIALLPDIGEPL